MNQKSVFIDREAQVRFWGVVRYSIVVDQECHREVRRGSEPWRDTGGSRMRASGVVKTVSSSQDQFGCHEFHVRAVDFPRTKVRQTDNKTFAARWSEVGEKGTTSFIQGTVVISDIEKLEKWDGKFPSSWKVSMATIKWT